MVNGKEGNRGRKQEGEKGKREKRGMGKGEGVRRRAKGFTLTLYPFPFTLSWFYRISGVDPGAGAAGHVDKISETMLLEDAAGRA